MIKQLDISTRKALSFEQDMVFRLLLVMTVLLGWVAGIFAGGVWGLEKAYENWHANQSSKVAVYLMPETEQASLQEMIQQVQALKGVRDVRQLSDEDVRGLMAPYFVDGAFFPLPIVVETEVENDLNRVMFEDVIHQSFPTAEIDDPRQLLSSIGTGVRVVQGVTSLMGVVIVGIMALLVSLTVRAGLVGQRHSLKVLQYIGATDALLTDLVVRQVAIRSLLGFAGAVALCLLTLFCTYSLWEPLRLFMTAEVWIAGVVVPFLLVVVAVVVAFFVTRSVVR